MKKIRPAPTACDIECPVKKTAVLLDGKWTTLIVRDLLSGKKRYSELLHSLAQISPKVLAARLRFLERHGLIEKTIYPTVPPKTEYALTTRGSALSGVIDAMAKFGRKLKTPS